LGPPSFGTTKVKDKTDMATKTIGRVNIAFRKLAHDAYTTVPTTPIKIVTQSLSRLSPHMSRHMPVGATGAKA